MRTKRLTEPALLAAIALTIFAIELRVPNPFPIPGIKLGLANIITVYALYHYRAGEVLMVLLTRIFLGALFAGSMLSLLYSLAGGMFCRDAAPAPCDSRAGDMVCQCDWRGPAQCRTDSSCRSGNENHWCDRIFPNPFGFQLSGRSVYGAVRPDGNPGTPAHSSSKEVLNPCTDYGRFY